MVRILPLSGHHDRKTFDCGNAELNRWLANVARQHRDKGISSTFVATDSDTSVAIYGYYSVSISELRNVGISASWAKKYPQRIPVFRIGRLAVSTQQQGNGLGRILLANAFERLSHTAAVVGGMGILVDSKPDALPFYQRYGFEPLADNPLELFMPFQRS